jgi:hypothetical protein
MILVDHQVMLALFHTTIQSQVELLISALEKGPCTNPGRKVIGYSRTEIYRNTGTRRNTPEHDRRRKSRHTTLLLEGKEGEPPHGESTSQGARCTMVQ